MTIKPAGAFATREEAQACADANSAADSDWIYRVEKAGEWYYVEIYEWENSTDRIHIGTLGKDGR